MDLPMTQETPAYNNGVTPTCTLSVIVPAYNEEEVLPIFHQRLVAALTGVPGKCEVIYVDDGSTDRTAQLLGELHPRAIARCDRCCRHPHRSPHICLVRRQALQQGVGGIWAIPLPRCRQARSR